MSSSDDSGRWLSPNPITSSLGALADRASTRIRGTFSWSNTPSDRITLGGVGHASRGGERAEQIEPPRDAYDKYRKQYDTTPLLSAPIDQMASDVLADGWRVEADDERTQEFLAAWGEQCAIVAGEPNKDFIELLDLWNKVYDIYGTPIVENVTAKRRPDAVVGFKMVPPSTVTYHTRPGSSMLLRPDDTEVAPKLTERGTAAAYTQYDEDAGERWTDGTGHPLSERRLDAEQITRAVRNPDPGAVTGTSAIESVSEQVETIKNHFRNDEFAIESAAWKQLFIGYEPLVVETPQGVEIKEFDESTKGSFEETVEGSEPGSVITHDGKIHVQDVSGEVADIVGRYEFFVDYILNAMPAPKYKVGHADNLNRDIAGDQADAHEKRVKQRKELISRTFTPVWKRVAEQFGYDPSGVEVKLAPPQDISPVLSLTNEQMERVEMLANAIDTLSGDAPGSTLIGEEQLIEEVLQMDYGEAGVPLAGVQVDESDPEVRKQANRLIDDIGISPGPGSAGSGSDE